jgi:hypothetical protein
MDSCSIDTTLKTITVNSGAFYYNRQRFAWAGAAYDVDLDFATDGYRNLWRTIFGFNTNSLEFEFKIIENTAPANQNILEYEAFFPLWTKDFSVTPTAADWSTWNMTDSSTAYEVFTNQNIDINLALNRNVKITIKDVAGRERDFTYIFVQTAYNVWRYLTVTKPSDSSELLPGVIHQEASLNLALSSEDWELDDVNGRIQ